ncbi:twin-arginine translocase subunit TatC [bacterium]|nr:twin-arginine translocase subunit TatC [bacterium]
MDHLTELRSRLITSMIAIVVCSIVAFVFANQVLELLLNPFTAAAVQSGLAAPKAYFTAPLELFMLKLKISMLLGLAGAFPVIAWQIYAFVAPGLYKHERGAVAPFIMAIPMLFAAGGSVVYFVLLPLVMNFAFSQQMVDASTAVEYLPKVTEYYGLAIALLGAFGMAFQLPVVLSLLAKAELVTVSGLQKWRKYAIVVIFAVSMFMTPPDVFSQTILAVPVYGLYEASIVSVWLIERARRREDAAREAAEKADAKTSAAKSSKSATPA